MAMQVTIDVLLSPRCPYTDTQKLALINVHPLDSILTRGHQTGPVKWSTTLSSRFPSTSPIQTSSGRLSKLHSRSDALQGPTHRSHRYPFGRFGQGAFRLALQSLYVARLHSLGAVSPRSCVSCRDIICIARLTRLSRKGCRIGFSTGSQKSHSKLSHSSSIKFPHLYVCTGMPSPWID